jgi:hypothetical protein
VLSSSLAGIAQADTLDVDIKFTAKGLGFTTDDGVSINHGKTVDPDAPGKMITSSTTGEGSFLYIQTDGLAGSGTALNPLFLTVTGKTHLDNDPADLPGTPHDYQAGVITLSKEDGGTPGWGEGRNGYQSVHGG